MCRGIPCSQSRNGLPERARGKGGIFLWSIRNLPFKELVSTRKTRHESPLTPLSLCAYKGIKPQRSPSLRIDSCCSQVRPDRYIFLCLLALTSIGKHRSPRNASRSPLPSIPLPAALTTRKGLLMTCMALAV